jgi:hypothetical protein
MSYNIKILNEQLKQPVLQDGRVRKLELLYAGLAGKLRSLTKHIWDIWAMNMERIQQE